MADISSTINFHDIHSIDDDILKERSVLFSSHYGNWNSNKKQIRLSPSRLKSDYLFDDTCRLSYAEDPISKKIIGQIFYTMIFTPLIGNVIWINQMVVHSQYRNLGIARTLMSNVLIHKHQAVGMASSNPYAIKTMESATGMLCKAEITNSYIGEVIKHSNIKYLKEAEIDRNGMINTHFDIDHTRINEIIKELGWVELPDEYEYIGLVIC